MSGMLSHLLQWHTTVRRNTSSGLVYFEPNAPAVECPRDRRFHHESGSGRHFKYIPPLQDRQHLAMLLEHEKLTRGVEVGVQAGDFAVHNLRNWKSCSYYLLVDIWAHQASYADGANAGSAKQEHLYKSVRTRMQPWRNKVAICRNLSVSCAETIPDLSLDFVYIDARHDYKGCLQDLLAYWPKLRPGGIMAGHDYIYAGEHPSFTWGFSDYSINYDGTRDPFQRAVKGAVDEFFSTCVRRQVVVTYRDKRQPFNTWMVRK